MRKGSTQQSIKLSEQIEAIQSALVDNTNNNTTTGAVATAVSLWNGWYGGDAGRFRVVNPDLPEAVGLLRARLLLYRMELLHPAQEQRSPGEGHLQAHERRQGEEELLKRARLFLDSLAVSQWGEKCAGKSSV